MYIDSLYNHFLIHKTNNHKIGEITIISHVGSYPYGYNESEECYHFLETCY